MARPRNKDGVQIESPYDPVQVDVTEVEARRGVPMAEQPGLDVLQTERLPEQRFPRQVNMTDR